MPTSSSTQLFQKWKGSRAVIVKKKLFGRQEAFAKCLEKNPYGSKMMSFTSSEQVGGQLLEDISYDFILHL